MKICWRPPLTLTFTLNLAIKFIGHYSGIPPMAELFGRMTTAKKYRRKALAYALWHKNEDNVICNIRCQPSTSLEDRHITSSTVYVYVTSRSRYVTVNMSCQQVMINRHNPTTSGSFQPTTSFPQCFPIRFHNADCCHYVSRMFSPNHFYLSVTPADRSSTRDFIRARCRSAVCVHPVHSATELSTNRRQMTNQARAGRPASRSPIARHPFALNFRSSSRCPQQIESGQGLHCHPRERARPLARSTAQPPVRPSARPHARPHARPSARKVFVLLVNHMNILLGDNN